MSELPRGAQMVQNEANALGLDITIIEMAESTRTAADAAKACACDIAQIVKSLIFRGADTGKPYLLLVSGANRVDEARAGAQIGEPLERPDAEFVRTATGFAIGGVAPFGHATQIDSFIDETLLRFDTVWAAAGTPRCLFAVSPAKLKQAIAPAVISVC